jgi:hypothetical protein
VEELERVAADPLGISLVELRRLEMGAFAAGLTAKAASRMAAVLRLPAGYNGLMSTLVRLADCARADHPNRYKLNRLLGGVQQAMLDLLPPGHMGVIDRPLGGGRQAGPKHVKIVADAPLEWLPIRGLPLALRFDASRIPGTPGDLFHRLAIDNKVHELDPAELRHVLILRSFENHDPVRPLVERAVGLYHEVDLQPKRVEIDLVDVSSVDEVIHALNRFQGNIVVFDCHGRHRRKGGGTLDIGGASINPWTLVGLAQIPPIVLLSACDTYPIDASQASVAMAFLAAGAVTVGATLLTVNAAYSALFIGRLLLHLDSYLEEMCERAGRSIRWTRVFSDLLRLQTMTEILARGDRNIGFDSRETRLLEDEIRTMIYNGQVHWYERLVDGIVSISGRANSDVERSLSDRIRLLEASRYVQLGNPENIVIRGRIVRDAFSSLVRRLA